METNDKASRLEQAVERLKIEIEKRQLIVIVLQNKLLAMEEVTQDFIKQWKLSQTTDETKEEEQIITRSAPDDEFEESPPYILVFHGVQRDWMEEVEDQYCDHFPLQTVETTAMRNVVLEYNIRQMIEKAAGLTAAFQDVSRLR